MAFLRKALNRQEVNRVWRAIYERSQASSRACPSCERAMREVSIVLSSGKVQLDGCRSCQLVWFDETEFGEFSTPPTPVRPTREYPLEAREAIARLEIAKLEVRRRRQREPEGPDEVWKAVPAVLGFPVEEETSSHDRAPWVTWGLAFLVFVTSIASSYLPELSQRLAWIPAEPLRLGGLTFLTSFFVHAGPAHLIGNLYFLLTFGDDVENLLGSLRFLTLLLVAELAAALGHLLLTPDPTIAVVGASGGISGVLAYYAVRLPRARIGLFVLYYFRGGWISFPAWLAFAGWLILQIAEGVLQSRGLTSVSAGAHLGGAAVGLALGFLARRD
jgi:membrane associated rhomboid family serine protease/Zn-finger nucleic acid-binding protein